MNGKILTVSAHPDDWELGCGGTIECLKREGCECHHFVLGNGRGTEFDNEFDKITLAEWIYKVEIEILKLKPEIIFTHYANDLNIDHQITYKAVITAARPQPDCCVKEIYSFEVPSSTEWNAPNTFCPNMFFEIKKDDLDKKIHILKENYSEEMREYPHPRSQELIESLAMVRGVQCGRKFAEAFKTVRRII